MGCIAVAAGGYVIHESPLTVTVFDRLKGETEIKQRGLFKNSTHRYAITEIETAGIVEKKDSEGDPVYQPQLILRNQQTVPLSSLWVHNREGNEEVVAAVQDFLDVKKG